MSIVDTTYADIAEADVILAGVTPWTAASTPNKQAALEWAVVYMSEVYTILEDSVSVGLTNANALLANEHLTSDLFTADRLGVPVRGLTSSSVEAEGVKSSKSWDAHIAKSWKDPFPRISAMLKYYGFPLKKSSGGIATVPMVRR